VRGAVDRAIDPESSRSDRSATTPLPLQTGQTPDPEHLGHRPSEGGSPAPLQDKHRPLPTNSPAGLLALAREAQSRQIMGTTRCSYTAGRETCEVKK
jgi:hypothetical protein